MTTTPNNSAPIDFETEIGPLPLRGGLPASLRGTLVRNGPNPLVPEEHTHWFKGDGMLHAFHIADGQVHYRNRWVRTGQWQQAARTGRNPTVGKLVAQQAAGTGATDLIEGDNGAANTNVIHHAGRMLALEEAHLPIEMEAGTLATRGTVDFGGRAGHRFTAHPKADPRSGELLFFAYGTPEPLSAGMGFGVLNADGQLKAFEHFEAPYASMVHDFAITARHVLFPIMPLTASQARAAAGGPPFAWEPAYGTRVGLMPRGSGAAQMQWWTGPACYVYHLMNAWEDESHVYADVIQFDRPPLFPLPDGTPAAGAAEPGWLTRWTLDLAGPERVFTTERLHPIPGEFPRIDERRTGLAYRHGWFAGFGDDAGDGTPRRLFCRLVHIDHVAPQVSDRYDFDAFDRVSEPVFVPRADEAEDGDGWLLATVWRSATNRSDLVVFDARQLSKGPVCTASLPHRVPDGFHGNWFPEGAVALGEQA